MTHGYITHIPMDVSNMELRDRCEATNSLEVLSITPKVKYILCTIMFRTWN